VMRIYDSMFIYGTYIEFLTDFDYITSLKECTPYLLIKSDNDRFIEKLNIYVSINFFHTS